MSQVLTEEVIVRSAERDVVVIAVRKVMINLDTMTGIVQNVTITEKTPMRDTMDQDMSVNDPVTDLTAVTVNKNIDIRSKLFKHWLNLNLVDMTQLTQKEIGLIKREAIGSATLEIPNTHVKRRNLTFILTL